MARRRSLGTDFAWRADANLSAACAIGRPANRSAAGRNRAVTPSGKSSFEDALGLFIDHAARGSRLSRARSPLVCSSDRLRAAAIFPSSISRESLVFSSVRPGVSTPDPAAWEIGSPPRPRRMIAHPTAIAAPISGPATYTQ